MREGGGRGRTEGNKEVKEDEQENEGEYGRDGEQTEWELGEQNPRGCGGEEQAKL